MLLRNGSIWFVLTPRNHVTSDVPGDSVSQQFAADGRQRIKLLFVRVEITSELVRIFLHQINRYVLDVRLSDITQSNHPSDIESRNNVLLFNLLATTSPKN